MRSPVHLGALPDASAVGAVGNPACGDVVTIHLRIEDDRITAASFESMGSAYQLATASVLCDCVLGQTPDEAAARTPACITDKLPDLPPRFQYLARLGVDALQRAIRTWRRGDAPPVDDGADEAGGRAFVLRILGNGKRWSTREIEAMARADAVGLPRPLARFLSELRRDGVIEGELDMERRGWAWWL